MEIRSTLAPGSLTYGEFAVPGRSREEVLFFTHVCHPSLANDNTSGMAVATALAKWVAGAPRRYSYRFVFAPGTIGSLCWLKQNERGLPRVRAGLVLGLLGDPGPLTYKMSRQGNTYTDAVARYVLSQVGEGATVMPFSPYGYDERQLCSPGFNLPIDRLTRSVNCGYPEYHTSADVLDLIRPEFLERSLEACKRFVTEIEDNRSYENRSPKGEPRLGKRGLYGAVGGEPGRERARHALGADRTGRTPSWTSHAVPAFRSRCCARRPARSNRRICSGPLARTGRRRPVTVNIAGFVAVHSPVGKVLLA